MTYGKRRELMMYDETWALWFIMISQNEEMSFLMLCWKNMSKICA